MRRAGTAGGIKVTTFFLLGLVVWAEVRGARDVTAFNRRISVDAQRQALAVALLGMAILAFATLALMALTVFPVEALLFEAISAFLLRATLKLLLKPVFSPRWSVDFQRRWLAGLARTTWLPGGVSIEQAEVGGVPGEWLRRRDVPPAKK